MSRPCPTKAQYRQQHTLDCSDNDLTMGSQLGESQTTQRDDEAMTMVSFDDVVLSLRLISRPCPTGAPYHPQHPLDCSDNALTMGSQLVENQTTQRDDEVMIVRRRCYSTMVSFASLQFMSPCPLISPCPDSTLVFEVSHTLLDCTAANG